MAHSNVNKLIRPGTSCYDARPVRAFLLGGSVLSVLFILASSVCAQQQKNKGPVGLSSTTSVANPPALTRTTTRHEVRRFGYGNTLTIYGAPEGSITIEAWPRSEIDIAADIELKANTEEELAQLAAVNNFQLDEDLSHISIITTGTHDRKFMRSVAKNFPKKLLALPWKIGYRIRVPAATDLEIYTGRGPLNLSGVEGAIRVNAGETTGNLLLTGGDFLATIERGSVTVRIPVRNWRGRGADIRLITGDLTVELPATFAADINAEVLRAGRVENTHPGLAPRDRMQATEHRLQMRAGTGGATLSFTVGEGTLRIKQIQ